MGTPKPIGVHNPQMNVLVIQAGWAQNYTLSRTDPYAIPGKNNG